MENKTPERLETVEIVGKRVRPEDPLVVEMREVAAIIGQPVPEEVIKEKADKFRKQFPGYTDTEIVELAKSKRGTMVANFVKRFDPEALGERKAVEAAGRRAAEDTWKNRFMPVLGNIGGNASSYDANVKRDIDMYQEPVKRAEAMWEGRQKARAVDLANAAEQEKLNQSRAKTSADQMALLGEKNLADPMSPVSNAYRAQVEGTLKSIGRADLIPKLEGLSKSEIEVQLPGIKAHMDNMSTLAQIRQANAATGFIGAQTATERARGTQEKFVADAMSEGGADRDLPASIAGRVQTPGRLAVQEHNAKRLVNLEAGAESRTDMMNEIKSIETVLKNPRVLSGWNLSKLGEFTAPEDQQILAKSLNRLVNAAASGAGTDAERALVASGQANPKHWPNVIRKILEINKGKIARDEFVHKQLRGAAQGKTLGNFSEEFVTRGAVVFSDADGSFAVPTGRVSDVKKEFDAIGRPYKMFRLTDMSEIK